MHISLNFQTSYCNLKIKVLVAKFCVFHFYYFAFERNYDVLSQRVHTFVKQKHERKKKTNQNGKWKIPHMQINLALELI